MTVYEDLIMQLGDKIGTTLRPDQRNCCLLSFPDGVSIQIDLDSSGDLILCGCHLGTVLPGAFRERLFRQALIFNGLEEKKSILAFSSKNDELICFQYLQLASLTSEKLYKLILNQADFARSWIEAIKNGNLPTIEGPSTKSGYMGVR